MSRVAVSAIALAAFASTVALAASPSQKYLVNVGEDRVILDGYDPVALVSDGKLVRGKSAIATSHQGAIYRFASQENKQRFDKNPEKYRPQFGGYCAMSVTMGKLMPGDVHTWSIVDGRLVVQLNEKAAAMWKKNPEGHLKKADQNWPKLVAEHRHEA